MISRRGFLHAASTVCAATALRGSAALAEAFTKKADPVGEEDVLRWVDLHIGTGGHGHCYPGATVPFGAVQLSPDTFNDGWDWCSGYHISDASLMGFSHTHLSGTGCGDLLDFLIMAGTGPAKIVPGPRDNPDAGYRSRFDRRDEVAEPGYYSVLLKDYGIRAELTATERTGLHRYTFPASSQAYLVLDLQHAYLNNGKPTVMDAEIIQPSAKVLSGGRRTQAWAHGRHSYFSLEVSKTPTHITFFSDDQEVAVPEVQPLRGINLKCVLHFETTTDEVILVKTGISAVSAENAAKNLAAELPGWDFDAIRQNARTAWQRQIGKVVVTTQNTTHKRIFYSALYHASLGPTRFDDVDGRYRGMDGEVHTLPTGAQNYTTFSLWDTYRALHPLFTLIEQPRVPHLVNSLVRMAAESPSGMPVWPLQGVETGTMTGYHSAAVIAEACNKGFTRIDYEKAYACLIQRAMVDDYRGLGFYRKMHYIPADLEAESVSKTFEYCYDDWAISHVAARLGRHDIAHRLRERSKNYRRYFDPSIGFMRPRLDDGSWATPFSPIEMGHSSQWRDYTESNPWQTTFSVQHDPAGLIHLFGGRKPFLQKLDGLFAAPSDLPPDAPPDIAGLVGQYAHGNEPSHHIAYLYAYAGAPYKTQSRVRSLLETMYKDAPDGLEGNEDVGQMSAWYILSALGFYPVDAVSGNYILGSPLFESALVDLGENRRLEIEVRRSNPDDVYIQSFALNGVSISRAWFHHSEISLGGKLTFTMGPKPNHRFGFEEKDIPPSL